MVIMARGQFHTRIKGSSELARQRDYFVKTPYAVQANPTASCTRMDLTSSTCTEAKVWCYRRVPAIVVSIPEFGH